MPTVDYLTALRQIRERGWADQRLLDRMSQETYSRLIEEASKPA